MRSSVRSGTILSTLICIAVALTTSTLTPATGKLAVPATGVYLGLWGNTALAPSPEKTIEAREGPAPLGIGRTFALHLNYYHWTDIAAQLSSSGVFQPDFTLQGDIAHGRVPVISWKCDDTVPNSNHVIAGGDPNADAVITASAKALAQYPGPVMLRWFWEFNQLNKNQSCRGDSRGAPTPQVYADFIGAWQHIWTLFQKAGATNVVFVWNPGVYTSGAANDAHGYYPGNAYVDWIALDTYQRTSADTFIADFDGFYNDFSKPQYAGKPLMLGENGSFGYTLNNLELQSPYLQGFLAAVQANRYPLLKAYDYFDAGGLDTAGVMQDWAFDDNNGKGNGGLQQMTIIGASSLFSAMPQALAVAPTITSISVCSPTGKGAQGNCPNGMFDTHQIVLAPDGSGLAINHYEASYASDEHSSVFAPGTLGGNNDYLFFVASGSNASAGIGTMVLSGRSGPDETGQWTFDIPKADGYGAYSGGFGQVFRQPFPEAKCPAVANPTQQDATFDLDYAAPGSVLKDPTGPPGSLLMIYEGANDCSGNSGGNRTGLGAYISVGVATSLDYGKTWPTYRGTSTFNFVPLPGANQTQGPNAPLGARGANVCLGNDCSTTPPATYGRYPVLMPSPSITSVMSSGQPLNGSIGASNMSAFLDDISGAPAPYVYVVYNSRTVNDLAIARGQLNGGSAPLSFSKWNGTSFSAPGVGGTEAPLLPNGVRQNCGAAAQTRQNGSIDFLDATQQYVLFFTCTSNGDPALPSGTGIYGAAWFYSTSSNLSDPTTWSTPQEIAGSWVPFDTSGQCNSYPGWYHTWMSLGEKPGHLSTAGHVFYLWGCEDGSPTAPPRRYSSRMFTITTSVPLPTPFVDAGQAMPTNGGSGSVTLTFPAGYSWTASTTANWITITSSLSGTGSGTVSFSVAANSGGDRTASIIVAGFAFTIEQEAATVPGLSYIGSMPHIAAEENWTTAFTLVNKGTSPATARLSFFGDPSGTLTLPLAFPQVQPPLPELAASLDRTISTNASAIIDSAGPQTPPVQIGSAQLAATGAVDGFAIFHLIPGAQEAVVPLETRNASSYLLPFDNTAGVVLGVAVENVSAQAAAIPVVIRDDAGTVIGPPGATLSLAGNGHYSFVLSTLYPVTAGKRGTIEFDTPAGGQISVLGIRTTPLGTTNTLTTIPALASVGTSGGSIAHIATGNGWQTTFVLVNTGTSAAQVHLKFFADVTGAPLSLPLSFPQAGSGTTTVAPSVNQTLAAGATLLVQSAAPLSNPTPTIGSAQLTTNGNVGGFVIFRYNPNGQEAVVPLESRTANAYILAFDNTNGTATGVAINSVSLQAVNVPVIVRDDSGAQIASDTLNLAPNGHLAFTLVTDKYPATQNIRGTIEFDTPAGAQIGALGIRIPVAHTFTTLPALAR